MTTVAERIGRADLTPAERRVAEVVLEAPEAVAFGTVARVAERASTSGPSVVRAAVALGVDGFAELQAAVQEELAGRLRPAAERIRRRPAPDPLARALEVELENVHATLVAVDPASFSRAVTWLAEAPRVAVVSGDATFGVAHSLVSTLSLLRDGVDLAVGSPVQVMQRLALLDAGDALVAIDLRRYERWVLDAVANVCGRAATVAITDSVLSPLAQDADAAFVVDAQGAGPFDSHVGTLALANALVSAVSGRLRRTAARRLDRIENAWAEADTLMRP